MKLFKLTLLVLFLVLAFSEPAFANVPERQNTFDSGRMEETVKHMASLFMANLFWAQAIAYIILTSVLILKGFGGKDILESLQTLAICAALVGVCAQIEPITKSLFKAGDALGGLIADPNAAKEGRDIGYGMNSTAIWDQLEELRTKLYEDTVLISAGQRAEAKKAMQELEGQVDDSVVGSVVDDIFGEGFGDSVAEAGSGVVKAFNNVREGLDTAMSFGDHLKAWFVWICMAVVIGVLMVCVYICQIIIGLFMLGRVFIMYFSIMCLPIFVSGMVSQTFRNQSHSFIFGVLGVATWPIGWGIANIITQGIYGAIGTSLAGRMSGQSALWAGGDIDAEASTGLFYQVAQQGDPTGATETIMGMLLAYAGDIVVIVSLILILLVWVFFSTLYAPFKMSKLVTSGANFAAGMLGGGVKAGAEVGKLMAVGGTGAMIGAAMSGGIGGAKGGSGEGSGSASGSEVGASSGHQQRPVPRTQHQSPAAAQPFNSSMAAMESMGDVFGGIMGRISEFNPDEQNAPAVISGAYNYGTRGAGRKPRSSSSSGESGGFDYYHPNPKMQEILDGK